MRTAIVAAIAAGILLSGCATPEDIRVPATPTPSGEPFLPAWIDSISGECQEDEPCWDPCTMGNKQPCPPEPTSWTDLMLPPTIDNPELNGQP